MRVDQLKKKILERIDQKKDELIKLCCDVVKIPSENPPGDTTEIADFLRQYLEERRFNVKTYEPKKANPNLVATYAGTKQKPNLMLNAHMDTFPAGSHDTWDFPPFCGEVKKGKILGRGSADMKGGLTVSVFTFALFKEIGIELPGKLTLTLVSDEETGGKWGTEWLLDNVSDVKGDACLNTEPSGLSTVWIGEKGVCWLRLKASGVSAHGAVPMLGDNAIVNMSKVIPIAESFRKVKGKIPREIEGIIEEARAALEAIPGFGKGTGVVLDHVSVNVGTIKGGTKTNLVPESCEMELDTRVPIGMTPKELKQKLETELHKAGLGMVKCEFINATESSYTSPDERIIELVCKNAKEIIGQKLKYGIWVGGTDARFFRQRGIPAAIYGTRMFNIGAANEYIEVDDLINVAKVHAATIVDYYQWK